MLLRSSSTPFMPSFLTSSSPSPPPPSSLHLRRAFSDGHLPSLHPSSSSPSNNSGNKTTGPGLHTELSFSIYHTFTKAPPPPPPVQENHQQEQDHQQQTAAAVQPELPLFLARGLGIDRVASGLFTAGSTGSKAAAARMNGAEVQVDEKVAAALDAQYKKMVDEQPGNALFLRNYAQFLHEVKGDPRRAEEYYSRAMLADPSDGEIMSQYAKLVWEVYRDQDRSYSYFQKSVQAAPQNSHVFAAYASFLWEQDDDFFGEDGQGMGGGALERAAHTGQGRELASAAV